MKPSFALSLSFDGIRLLHRAAGGWRLVGEVGLDAEDMAGELAVLRKTASALEPAGVRTKVLLPNEQIKYLSIATPGQDQAERLQSARQALDGATPYAVDDLAFDISIDGAQTHIAAVAKETLAEAESFAVDHRFHPVSFAAVPGDQAFLGEPNFGVTKASATLLEAGETVEPDGIAVVVIGEITMPTGPVAFQTAASNGPEVQLEDRPTSVLAEEVHADDDLPPPLAEAAQPAIAKDVPQIDVRHEEPAEQANVGIAAATVPEGSTPALGAATSVQREAAMPPAIGFASRRSPDKPSVPQLDGVRRAEMPAAGSVSAGRIDVEPDPPAVRPARTGFLSRRKTPALAGVEVIPATPPPSEGQIYRASTEAERMTVFGARKTGVGGKPRFLGLILTAALLVFLAGVAAWASVFLDDGISLSRLFGDRTPPRSAAVEEPAPPPLPAPQQDETDAGTKVASLDPGLSAEDTAVLDAMAVPVQPTPPAELTEEELTAKYAVTGIWPIAPDVPPEPAGLVSLEDLYLTSIDPVSTTTDAVALPAATGFATDIGLPDLASPAPAGTQFALDDRGLVIPTAEGALSPDGFTVVLGLPPVIPPATPTRFQTVPEDTAVRPELAALRPNPRPSDLAETTERAQLDGLTRSELAAYRPNLRPQSLQQQAEEAAAPALADPIATDGAVALALAAPSPIENATRLAIGASIRPDARPRNFDRIVKRADQAAPQQEEVRVASAAAVAPRAVQPSIPSKASVAKQATLKNAINLRDVNLIGVYGKPSSRRALVRLGNGRYQKVVVGDRIDGGRVSAIGESELRYTKRGRDLVLKMPR